MSDGSSSISTSERSDDSRDYWTSYYKKQAKYECQRDVLANVEDSTVTANSLQEFLDSVDLFDTIVRDEMQFSMPTLCNMIIKSEKHQRQLEEIPSVRHELREANVRILLGRIMLHALKAQDSSVIVERGDWPLSIPVTDDPVPVHCVTPSMGGIGVEESDKGQNQIHFTVRQFVDSDRCYVIVEIISVYGRKLR